MNTPNNLFRSKAIGFLLITCMLGACKKEKFTNPMDAGLLNIVNANIGLGQVKTDFNGSSYSSITKTTSYGGVNLYHLPSGIVTPLRVAAVSDTTKSFYQNNFQLDKDGFYSLYIAGIAPAVEAIFVKETEMPVYTDSAFAIRVVNLSPNSTPLNVVLSSSPTVNEFASVSYKQVSAFKKYVATAGVPNTAFNFQVKNAADKVIASYTLSAANVLATRFKSATLVIRGLVDATSGTNVPGITFVPNYQ